MTSELWFWILIIALGYGALIEIFSHWYRERNTTDEPDWRDEL